MFKVYCLHLDGVEGLDHTLGISGLYLSSVLGGPHVVLGSNHHW